MRHWSPQSEQLQCGGRSCPGHPLSCPGGAGPWHEPLPVTSTHCLRRGGGRAPALPPSCPAPGPGIGVAPERTPPPPSIGWKVQRRGGGRAPHGARSPRTGWPQTPPPARPHSAPCPVPSFVWKQRVVINPEMDVFSMPLVPLSSGRWVGGVESEGQWPRRHPAPRRLGHRATRPSQLPQDSGAGTPRAGWAGWGAMLGGALCGEGVRLCPQM